MAKYSIKHNTLIVELVVAAASMLHIDLMDHLIKIHSLKITNTEMGNILSAGARSDGDIKIINKILKTYAINNLSSASIKKMILAAAQGGFLDLVEELIAVYPQEVRSSEVLLVAAERVSVDLFQKFLEKNSRVRILERQDIASKIVNKAIKNRNIDLAQSLLKKYPAALSIVTYLAENILYPENTLYVAARSGSLDLVQWLLAEYPNEFEDYPMAQLIRAAARIGNIDLVAWLILQYSESLTENMMGDVLFSAACSENINLFKLLMKTYSRLFEVTQDALQSIFESVVGIAKVGFVIQFFKEYPTLSVNERAISKSQSKNNHDVTAWLHYMHTSQPSEPIMLPIRPSQ